MNIIERAKQEIKDEDEREQIEAAKVKLRAKKWWHLPFKITLTRR